MFQHKLIHVDLWCTAVYLANLALHGRHVALAALHCKWQADTRHSHTSLPYLILSIRWLARTPQIQRNKGENLLHCGQTCYTEHFTTHLNNSCLAV